MMNGSVEALDIPKQLVDNLLIFLVIISIGSCLSFFIDNPDGLLFMSFKYSI
nr:hypothetical protein FJNOHHKM_00002 [Escherichia coli]